jgi:hypothetical protein
MLGHGLLLGQSLSLTRCASTMPHSPELDKLCWIFSGLPLDATATPSSSPCAARISSATPACSQRVQGSALLCVDNEFNEAPLASAAATHASCIPGGTVVPQPVRTLIQIPHPARSFTGLQMQGRRPL